MLSRSTSQTDDRNRMLSGHCPDAKCQTKLYFPSYDSSIECTGCGQRHERGSLVNVQEVTDPEVALHNMVRNLLVGKLTPKQTADSVKVLGLSNYHCKLLSPLLTQYGMDKQGKAQPLTSLNQGSDVFDCSILGSRAFQLEPEHIGIMGYGRDQTGSAKYLKGTLEFINQLNGNLEVLIPIHADGDGHCLVHGISRALVGRELFWHALRTNLKAHFLARIAQYKNHFKDFLTDSTEWTQIIAESDPDYLPTETEPFGLQNIHIFGLANVLHRPIILLDSQKGIQSSGDYSGVFLPAFVPPEDCRGKDGSLNKPLCIAWSSPGRNHFIALVGVKGRPLPRLPRLMLTKAWGTPHELINSYIEFDADDMCAVGGDRSLADRYVQRLAAAMEEVFVEKYHIHPSVVADVHHYIYKRTGVVGLHQNIIIENTRHAVQNSQLFRCLLCSALTQIEKANVSSDRLRQGGELYELARKLHGQLVQGQMYAFPLHDLNCVYDAVNDELVPDQSTIRTSQCAWCQGKQLRQIRSDGSVVYFNGDRTTTPATNTKCNCGFKHFWNGKEYDNNPSVFSVPLKWKGQSHTEDVSWFQDESNTALNSNAYDIASSLVQKHFPRDFGSEKLVQQVVEAILQNTATQQEEYQPISLKDMPSTGSLDQSASSSPSSHGGDTPEHLRSSSSTKHRPRDSMGSPSGSGPNSPRVGSPRGRKGNTTLDESPSKIIMTGNAAKTLHKEELTMSEAERSLRKRIQDKAPIMQQHQQRPLVDESRQHKPPASAIATIGTEASHVMMETANEPPQGKESQLTIETVARVAEPPKQKRIRLTSSDRKPTTLVLEASTTFSELQAKIETALDIKAANQKIRYGFPPKELTAPGDGDQSNQPVPLQNGDRVTVEDLSLSRVVQPMELGPTEQGQHSLGAEPGSSTPSEGGGQPLIKDDIMKAMENLQEDSDDSLDLRLYLMAMLAKNDLWTYVQKNPALFERGGIFYSIVERDLGLSDGKHFKLPSIPNKKFTYNANEDRIEVCLEPRGHFPIRPGVDAPESQPTQNVDPEDQSEFRSDFITDVRRKLKAGGSGVVTSGGKQISSYKAFSGHAHTLASVRDSRLSSHEVQEMSKQREVSHSMEQQEQSPKAVEIPEGSAGSEPTEKVKLVQSKHEIAAVNRNPSKAMDQSIFDPGDANGNKMSLSGSTNTNDDIKERSKMEQSKMDSRGESEEKDIHMDTDVQDADVQPAPSSPLPMEVDSATANPSQSHSTRPSGDHDSPVYVSKRLGPGYTVLVEQSASDTPDSILGEHNIQDT